MRLGFKSQVKRFFGFSTKQTYGFMVLLPLSILIIFSEPLYRNYFRGEPDVSQGFINLDSLKSTWEFQKVDPDSSNQVEDLFMFDPNAVSFEELKALRFSNKLARQLINYRSKGGRFMIKIDLLKLYGIDSSFYQQLEPFITLPSTKAELLQRKSDPVSSGPNPRKPPVSQILDLNVADTSQLQEVYGIGPVLSKRIVKYRDKLGGFVMADQLLEVYGLDSSVVQLLNKKFFIKENFIPAKIEINKVAVKELSDHPYISKSVANAIVTYRFQHGNFTSVNDLKKIHGINANMIDKISPYLSFD